LILVENSLFEFDEWIMGESHQYLSI